MRNPYTQGPSATIPQKVDKVDWQVRYFNAGYECYWGGRDVNPWKSNTWQHNTWYAGWSHAKSQDTNASTPAVGV